MIYNGIRVNLSSEKPEMASPATKAEGAKAPVKTEGAKNSKNKKETKE